MPLFISSAWLDYENLDIKSKIEKIVSNGLNNIELSGGEVFYENILEDILCLQKKYNINYIIHNYFPPPRKDFVLNIASENKENLNRSVNFIKENIELVSQFNNKLYTFHAGYSKKLSVNKNGYFKPDPGEIDWEKTYQVFYKSLDDILSFAVEKQVKIGIENLFPYNKVKNYSIMCSEEEIEELLNKYEDNKYLGLLLDLGHLNVAANYMKFDKYETLDFLINKYRNKIFEIHLSENDGSQDAHLPIQLDGWQIDIIKKYSLFDKPIVIEAKGLTFDKYKRMLNELEGE
ncbi:TIM barrel protein [Halocella sp. SP3-1]|uniref:TIM barrel protein n=1 Tax=Halocella sp. SP3-1 TaxID=2382161 RepID=UPI000F75AFF6|nr:TIM barrel protein [Halocella sp. SP3-1]AZO94017.1 hypothetical protein D7D81_05105 [Halocella sp. SP3-1]